MSNTRRVASRQDARCKHGRVLCRECCIVTDAARRMADAIGLAIIAEPVEVTAHGWMAFALEDGSTDRVVYPSKAVAIAHQENEFRYAYICLNKCMGAPPARDMQMWLDLHRHAYKNGGRLADPDEQEIMMPIGREQLITHDIVSDPMTNHWDFMKRFR